MQAIRRSIRMLALAAVLCAEACSENGVAAAPSAAEPGASEGPGTAPASEAPGSSGVRVSGNASRVVGSSDVGSRLTPPGGPDPATPNPLEGDWSFDLGAPVNSPVAITGSFVAAGCGDRLFAGANTPGAPNLFAFDNLHAKGANGVACTNVVDARCSPSPTGHCPHLLWSQTLLGAMDGNGVTPSLDGSVIYVATTTGALYALDATTGATVWVLDVRSAFGIVDATFRGVTPWVDYGTGNVFVAGWSPGFGIGAIGKISATGTVLSYVLLPAGIISTPILYNGFIYMSARDGKIYKVADGANLTLAGGAWPVTLQSGQPIISSPTVDTVNDRLFAALNDTLYSISMTTGAIASTSISTSGAAAPCASSPFVDLGTLSVFVGHKGSIWRASYSTAGAWTGTRSAAVKVNDASTANDPTSSPLVFSPLPGTTYAYLGDFGGYLNRWTASTLSTPSTFPSGATGVGAKIESPIMVDYMNGNIYFGASTGRIYQIGQVSLL